MESKMKPLKLIHRTPKLAELKVSYRRRHSRGGTRKNGDETSYVITNSSSCETYLRQIWNK